MTPTRSGNGATAMNPPASGAQEKTKPATAETDSEPKQKSKFKSVILPIFGISALVLAGIWGVRTWRFNAVHAVTDDAYITNDVVQITPQVAGNVAQVLVKENQEVKAGQPLVILDDATFRAALDSAKASLAVAEANALGAGVTVDVTSQTSSAQIQQAQGVVGQAEGAIGSAIADVAKSRASIANARAGSATAVANVKTAEAGLYAARTAKSRSQATLVGVQAQVGISEAALHVAEAGVRSAQASADRNAKDYERYKQLFAQNAVSAQQVDLSRSAALSAQAQLESAKDNIIQARAAIEQRKAEVDAAREAVRTADATIAQAQAQIAAAKQGVNAANAVIEQNQAQYTSSQHAVAQAEAKRSQAIGQLQQANTAPKQIDVSRANRQTAAAKVLEARAAVETAQINLNRTKLVAPMDGIVSRKSIEPGQQLSVGQQLMVIVPKGNAWVVANYKETQTHEIRPGQEVEVEVDSFPGHAFRGKVESIAQGTGATFSLLPADNATGNFTKVVQRVPVKVVFDLNQPDLDRLRSGLSTVVTISTK